MHTPTYSTTRRLRRHVVTDLLRAMADYAPGGAGAGMPFYVHTGCMSGTDGFDIVTEHGAIYGMPFTLVRFTDREDRPMLLVTLPMFGTVVPIGVLDFCHFDHWDVSGRFVSSSSNTSEHLVALLCAYVA